MGSVCTHVGDRLIDVGNRGDDRFARTLLDLRTPPAFRHQLIGQGERRHEGGLRAIRPLQSTGRRELFFDEGDELHKVLIRRGRCEPQHLLANRELHPSGHATTLPRCGCASFGKCDHLWGLQRDAGKA